MAANDDYYKFLDVPPTASQAEIRSAYRRMAFKYHPDRNKDPWAESIFKQINEAYQVLGNPDRRAAYDAERRAEARRTEERQRGQQEPGYTHHYGGSGGAHEWQGSRTSGSVSCPICNRRNTAGTRFCGNCGLRFPSEPNAQHGGQGVTPEGRVPNYLPQAILATVCCCPPFGIVSIIHAARVNRKVAIGDIKGAKISARHARSWILVSLGVGLALWIYAFMDLLT